MSNITKTDVDNGSVILDEELFRDELLTAAGAHTFKAGTILARQSVASAITPAAGANTGNGTCTLASVQAGEFVPEVGTYTLRCVAAATNGGTFRLEDPEGEIVEAGLVLTAGSGGANAFKAGGLAFTITDGSTDFAVGDTFTLPVTAGGKLVAYSPTGVGGAQIPVAVLPYQVVAAGAGDTPIRALISGVVNKNRLVIDADGDDSNITAAILDKLRDADIVAQEVSQLDQLDN